MARDRSPVVPRFRRTGSAQASPHDVVIAGAGPAGLACALALVRKGRPPLLLEKDSRVGGLCQTIEFNGYLFDIGGHRFLSKFEEVNELWREFLAGELLRVRRLSRIYYRGRFFKYPLSFFDTFSKLGPAESVRCVASYFKGRVFRPADDTTFEGWIINRFGRRLYDIFFDIYTQKVWAIPCQDLSADWARQRIQGLSLRVALKRAVIKTGKKAPKTLTEEFLYPRRGPGEFFDRLQQAVVEGGGRIAFNKKVSAVEHDGRRILAVELGNDRPAGREKVFLTHFVSSLPLPLLVKSLRPPPPGRVLAAAEKLRYRSFLVVNIILNKKDLFPDQWIYVHSPEARLGRIQNYKNWSPDMILDPNKTSLGLEYFCSEGDSLWRKNDIELIDFALTELSRIGIGSRKNLISGFVIRRADVYPVYSLDYRAHLGVIRDYLGRFENFQTIGRAGLFRYCNSDLALQMGRYAAERILGGPARDLWTLGQEQNYLEE